MPNQTTLTPESASDRAASIGEKSVQVDDATTIEAISEKGDDTGNPNIVEGWKDEDIVYPDGGLRAWLIVAGVRSHCFPFEYG